MTTSAKVHVGSAGRAATIAGVSGRRARCEQVDGAEVKTVSGKVLLGTTGAGTVSVRTVSGKVEIRCRATSRPGDASAIGQRARAVRL